jgi:hypothetical protein
MVSDYRVRKGLVWALPLVIVLIAVHPALAQDWAMVPGLGSINLGSATITPEIQVGYERLGLSFNLPASTGSLAVSSVTLDLQLQDAYLWVGSVGAVAAFPSGLSLALKGQTNAKRDVTIYEPEEFYFIGEQGVFWTGSKLEWWAIEGRLTYRLTDGCSFLAGLRRDQLSVNLRDPRDGSGNPLNFQDSGIEIVPLPPPFPPLVIPYERQEAYSSDLVSKLWIPYVGLEMRGPGYKASLIASPFASVEMRVPAGLLFDLKVFPGPVEILTADNLRYRVMQPAAFLEGSFRYDLNVSPSLNLGLWCEASWMSLKGPGIWDRAFRGQVPPLAPSFDHESQRNTASYRRQVAGGGLSAVWSF